MRPLDIRPRVLLAALLPVALLALVLATLFLFERVGDLNDAYRQKARAMARQIVAGSEYGLFSGNREALQVLLDRVGREDDVRSATLLDAAGHIVARTGKPGYGSLPEEDGGNPELLSMNELPGHILLLRQTILGSQLPLDDLFKESAAPVPSRLGQLVLELSMDKIVERAHSLRLTWSLITLACLLFGGLLAAWLSRGVIAPIVQLADVVARIGKGDLAARVVVDADGSLRHLEEGLNQMAAHIESGHEAMLRRIDEATTELRARTEEAECATQEVIRANNELVSIMEVNPDIVYVFDRQGGLVKWNTNFERFCGLTRERMLGRQAVEFVCAADRPAMAGAVRDVFENGTCAAEVHFVRHDGALVPYLCNGVVLRDANGTVSAFTGSGRDITERKRMEDTMQLAALVYRHSSEAILITDAENRIIAANPAFEKTTGYALDEVLGKNPRILGSGRHDGDFFRRMWDSINTGGYWQGELWDRSRSGEVYAKFLSINVVPDADGKPHRYLAIFSDITQKKKSEELIWFQANFDALTQLPNRRMFHDRLDQEIKKAHRAALPMALLFIDLDRFKEVNDSLGHDVGDILLQETAQRLGGCVRETDTVARLGGDEFAVVLGELEDSGSVDRVTQNILRKLAEPFQLGIETVYISASIGITIYPEDATAIEDLLKNADQAMYSAKRLGRNRSSYFTSAMQTAGQARMKLANELRGAIGGGQFFLDYQPIVELASGAIRKAEALIRWRHPTRGLIAPAEFIQIAEDTGTILDICDWVFREATCQVALWRKLHHQEFKVGVNMSPLRFHNGENTYAAWLEHLRELGLPGASVVVEVTESLLLDAGNAVADQVLKLRDAGIEISIDDFGTGYSSLASLKKFGIGYLKIDPSFVKNLDGDAGDRELCAAIIAMAHKLGLKTIAEGVETETQRALLTAAGCEYAQGYLFSRPVSAAEFEKLLEHAPG